MLQPHFSRIWWGGYRHKFLWEDYRHKSLVMFFLSCCTENRRKFLNLVVGGLHLQTTPMDLAAHTVFAIGKRRLN